MTDLLLALAGNSLVAAALGAAAWFAWRVLGAAWIAHALVVLGLLKLLTPPLFGPTWVGDPEPALRVPRFVLEPGIEQRIAALPASPLGVAEVALAVWVVGSVAMLAITCARHARVRRLLRRLDPAPLRVRTQAAMLAHDLGLAREPELLVTTARMSPFVFAIGCRPKLVLPQALAIAAPDRQLRAVLAHELAHLRGGDHRVRWLELVVAVVFWWHPVAHALRALLREVEEVRCDARAIAALGEPAKRYGRAILATAETLDGSPVPTGASGLDGGAPLERRLRAIATGQLASRLGVAARVALAVATLALLPLGMREAAAEPTVAADAARIAAALRELRDAAPAIVAPEMVDGRDPAAPRRFDVVVRRALRDALGGVAIHGDGGRFAWTRSGDGGGPEGDSSGAAAFAIDLSEIDLGAIGIDTAGMEAFVTELVDDVVDEVAIDDLDAEIDIAVADVVEAVEEVEVEVRRLLADGPVRMARGAAPDLRVVDGLRERRAAVLVPAATDSGLRLVFTDAAGVASLRRAAARPR